MCSNFTEKQLSCYLEIYTANEVVGILSEVLFLPSVALYISSSFQWMLNAGRKNLQIQEFRATWTFAMVEGWGEKGNEVWKIIE